MITTSATFGKAQACVIGIMPPLPRRAMVPDRNCRQLDCPVPIAHRGRGSAEVDLKATFSYKKKPHALSDTTNYEKAVAVST